MIFNEMNTTNNYTAVKESPYELGIGGALMHVYENECNYNALMKAAALSEMKYYNTTGGDLFVQEAGAFNGFIGKVKEFFKKVIEKIKSIAHKFMAKINQYTMKDKDFIKKYGTELIKRDLKDMEFNGYEFPAYSGNISSNNAVKDLKTDGSDDTDSINDIIDKNRGAILGENSMTESEFRDALKEKFYGDKDDIPVNIRTQLNIISETKELVKNAEKEKNDIIDAIEKMIKEIDKTASNINKGIKTTDNDDTVTKKTNIIKLSDNMVKVYKALSNDLTVYFGMVTKALNDKNRQAKAICVKALSYKHEAATVYENAYTNDIFAGVEIV